MNNFEEDYLHAKNYLERYLLLIYDFSSFSLNFVYKTENTIL
jgi:hypothetical protein